MTAEPFRIEPRLPPHAVMSYQAFSGNIPATCADVDCGAWLNGWKTTVPGERADEVRAMVTGLYRFTEARLGDGRAEFTFPPGQECFLGRNRKHRRPAEGRERWIVRGGDWRGNPRGEFTEHTRAEFWVEDFAEHQQKLADRLQEG